MPGRTMSQLENTSAILGEYMLKGWTLTDLHCDSCHVTPLMREPVAPAEREGRDRVQFCALCDGRPGQPSASSSLPVPAPTPSTSIAEPAPPAATTRTFDSPFGPISAPSSSSHIRRPAPIDSNDAAETISSLLLRGYSLLGDNCPNPSCKGVPLVGFPRKSDGAKDGRRMCVNCESRWVDERFLSTSGDEAGLKVVQTPTEERKEAGLELSPRTRARNALYGLSSEPSKFKGKEVDRDAFAASAKRSADELEGRNRDVEMDDALDELEDVTTTTMRPTNDASLPSSSTPLSSALSQTSSSLANTLQALSSALDKHASHPPLDSHNPDTGRWFVDLKLHTEAIKDVLGVVEQVERARRAGL